MAKTRQAGSPPWSRDELILALDLHLRFAGNRQEKRPRKSNRNGDYRAHSMVHGRRPWLTVDELRGIIRLNGSLPSNAALPRLSLG